MALRLANQYANALELGNTTIPVRSGYIALSGNDVMNYSTALTMTNTLLTNTTNDWTNTLNKFENQLQNDNLQALAGTSAMLVGTGLVAGGSLAMGSYLSTVQAGGYTLLGDALDMAATSPSLAMKIGGLAATSVAIGGAGIAVQTAYMATSGNDIVNYSTMESNCALLGNVNVFTTENTFSTSVNCASYQPLTPTGTITIGNSASPVQCPYDAVSGYDLVNYRTMGGTAVLLVANNEFTGTVNTFKYKLKCNDIQPLTTTATINIGTELVGVGLLQLGGSNNTINIGNQSSNTNQTISIGSSLNINKVGNIQLSNGSIDLFGGGQINFGPATGVVQLGTMAGSYIQIGSTLSTYSTIGIGNLTTTTSPLTNITSIDCQTLGHISIGMATTTANITIGQPSGTRSVTIGCTANNNFIGGLKVSGTDIQSIAASTTTNLLTTNTATLNIGNSATAVNIGGQ